MVAILTDYTINSFNATVLVFTWYLFSYTHKNDALEKRLWSKCVHVNEYVLSLKYELFNLTLHSWRLVGKILYRPPYPSSPCGAVRSILEALCTPGETIDQLHVFFIST